MHRGSPLPRARGRRRWAASGSAWTVGLGGERRRAAGAHRPRRFADGGDDVLVAGTAAEVALDGVADLVVGRIGVARQKVGGGHDHARRTEAALEAMLLPERGLERMEVVPGREALDRPYVRAVRLDGKHRARLDGHAVDVDGARAALAGIAAD